MPERSKPEARRGEHNEIGFRNVDEEADHDESGSQGTGEEQADERADHRSRDGE
jgi:hypothetical protein